MQRIIHHPRRGATMVMVALLMPVLVAMVAFAVDVGRMYLARNQLQTAVDAGALAAALQLRQEPGNIDAAIAAGKEFVRFNKAGAFGTVPEDAINVEAGTWNSNSRTFSAGGDNLDTVQVTGSLDQEPLFFGNMLGLTSFHVPRSAIALGGGSPLDIVMTLDLSGSMASQGRIEALRDAAPTFVNVIEEVGDNDRIGVMGYGALLSKYNPSAAGHSGVPYDQAPLSMYPPYDDWCAVKEADLTDDFSYLRSQVLDSGTLLANKYNGWTPVGAALRDSAHYLKNNARTGVKRIIVLMSDGRANKPQGNGPGYALEMATYASSKGITVYTISLGIGADEDLMQQIANVTGGEHFIASGETGNLSADLTSAFKKIADTIKQTQLVQ